MRKIIYLEVIFILLNSMSSVAQKELLLKNMISNQCLNCICRGRYDCFITRPFWEDAGRPLKKYDTCMKSSMRLCIKWTLQSYFSKYARDCNYDGFVDCFDFARIHTYGRGGCAGGRRRNMKYIDKCIARHMKPEGVKLFPQIPALIPAIQKLNNFKMRRIRNIM